LISVKQAWHSVLVTESISVGDVVAQQIRRYRQEKGWSVRELAEACAKHGAAQLTESSLANIERGISASARRKGREVSVDELVALAYVLGVPPLALLLPTAADNERIGAESIAVTPTVDATWYRVAGWLRAQWLLSFDSKGSQIDVGWMVRNFFEVMDAYDAACNDEADLHRRWIGQQVRPDSQEILRATEQMYQGSLGRYYDALRQMLDRSITPPRPRDVSRIIEGVRRIGYDLRPDVDALFASWQAEDGS
jgi:transcriptional regulator with XRE-family HTH domain